jgi:hypothetical protein
MLRFLGMSLLLATVFWLGYYTGQRPIGELKQTIMDLSRKVASASRSAMDNTIGLERNLRWTQGMVDAKAKVIQAKSELLDRNFGNAARELGEAEENLNKAGRAGEDDARKAMAKPLIEKVRAARADLALGKSVPRGRLDEIQKELDTLLGF